MNHFTADTHFGHEKACSFPQRKGFTVDTWVDMIIDIINKKVTKSDRLYILGDFALGFKGTFAKYRNRIRVKDLWLIQGNHDPSEALCKEVFGERFRITYETKSKGMPTWLSHYPHMFWPKSHYGSFHLFGHVHNQKTELINKIFPEMRSLDVCPESYKTIFGEWGIFSEDQVYDILITRKGHEDLTEIRKEFGSLEESQNVTLD